MVNRSRLRHDEPVDLPKGGTHRTVVVPSSRIFELVAPIRPRVTASIASSRVDASPSASFGDTTQPVRSCRTVSPSAPTSVTSSGTRYA